MRLNIHYKIMLILTGTVAIIFTGVYLYLNKNLKDHAYDRIRMNLTRQVSLAQLHLQHTINRLSQPQDIDMMAKRIGESLKLRVTIIGMDGKVLADSNIDRKDLGAVENHFLRMEVQGALKNGLGESHRFSTTIQKDMLYMARLFDSGSMKGFVRLAIPLSEITLISNNLKSLLLFALFFAFLVTIIVGSIAFFFVSKPIAEISSVTQDIARGNYDRKVVISTNDEIGDLSQSINYMSEQINAKILEVNASKSRLEAVLLSMCEGTMVVDQNGTILLINRVLSDFFEVDVNPIGLKSLEVIRNIEVQETIDQVLRSKASVMSQEISILGPEEKIFSLFAAPVLRGKELDGAVLVFHDITALKHLEMIRRDFVANVSHEIRTPLTSIKGYAETLLDGAIHDKDNALDFLKIISQDSNRLVQLVDDLLDLSKIESGKLHLRMASHSFERILDRVLSGLKDQLVDCNVTVSKDIPKNLPDVTLDDAGISQVLLNLLNNAIKYNNNPGTINISLENADEFIRVHIKDSGIGIPSDDLPRIFERFYRVDKARSRECGGTGLGLSIVKHIIQAHQGDVFVESQIDVGSTFSFTLPKK